MLHICCWFFNFIQGDSLFIAGKIVIRSEKKHAMALLSLSHGNTRAIPKSLRSLSSFIVVMPARAEWCTQWIFMVSQTLDNNSSYSFVRTKERSWFTGILLWELPHNFNWFIRWFHWKNQHIISIEMKFYQITEIESTATEFGHRKLTSNRES